VSNPSRQAAVTYRLPQMARILGKTNDNQFKKIKIFFEADSTFIIVARRDLCNHWFCHGSFRSTRRRIKKNGRKDERECLPDYY
jgi:hypothetical protein